MNKIRNRIVTVRLLSKDKIIVDLPTASSICEWDLIELKTHETCLVDYLRLGISNESPMTLFTTYPITF